MAWPLPGGVTPVGCKREDRPQLPQSSRRTPRLSFSSFSAPSTGEEGEEGVIAAPQGRGRETPSARPRQQGETR